MPKAIRLALALVLALAATAASAQARVKSAHPYSSTIRSTMVSSALGYPATEGTAVLTGTLHFDPFGDGAIVDRVTITGHPTSTVTTFKGTEVDFLDGGTLKSAFTGWGLLHPDGSLALAVNGDFTGGTGAYRNAGGTYHYTGSTPAGSTITSGRSTGSLAY
jgi:hypothetical protein